MTPIEKVMQRKCFPPEVETKARGVLGVTSAQLDLVWDPPWSPDMMSDAAKLDLGMI